MLKAVLFDLDGTLIDSTEAIIRSFFHTFGELGVEAPSREEIHRTISAPLEIQLAEFIESDILDAVTIYREHYFATSPENTELLPGVIETLEAIRRAGLKMGIATSKSRKGSEILLGHLEIEKYFDVLIGADDVKNHKPHPESLQICMKHMNVGPEESFYVGDTHYDTEAAKAANVRCVAVATGYATREQLDQLEADAVVDTMAEACGHILNSVKGLR